VAVPGEHGLDNSISPVETALTDGPWAQQAARPLTRAATPLPLFLRACRAPSAVSLCRQRRCFAYPHTTGVHHGQIPPRLAARRSGHRAAAGLPLLPL